MFNNIIQHFESLEHRPLERMLFLVGGLLFFWILEGAIPLVRMQYKSSKWKHAAVNFTFTIIHLVIHTFLAIGIIKLSDWCFTARFGLQGDTAPAASSKCAKLPPGSESSSRTAVPSGATASTTAGGHR